MAEENGKRLTKEQKELVIQWTAAGLESDEINKRAAAQTPPFHVSRSTISHYRKTRSIQLEQVQQLGELAAIVEGYNTAADRVSKLTAIAQLLEQDLLDGKLWLNQRKGIGPAAHFTVFEYQEFNGAEVAQYRGLLDDIAHELGGRAIKHEGEIEVDLIWDLPVPGFTPPANPSKKESAK